MGTYSLEDIKNSLIKKKEEAMENLSKATGEAKRVFERRIQYIENLLLKIHRGEITSEGIDILVSDAVEQLKEMQRQGRIRGGLVRKVRALYELTPPGATREIDRQAVNPHSFYQAVWRLQKQDLLGKDAVVFRTKKGLFFGRKEEPIA